MIIFGSSGHAQEIHFLLKIKNQNEVNFHVSEELEAVGDLTIINENQLENILRGTRENVAAAIAIGSGSIRNKIVDKFSDYNNLVFPNLLLGNEFEMMSIGSGNIFFPTFYSTVNVLIGNHNHFNLKVSLSHDVIIGDFNTFSPSVTIAGRVKIGDNVFFGVGVSVIDNVSICSNVVVGAGAVVIKNIISPGTYAGIPAKKIK